MRDPSAAKRKRIARLSFLRSLPRAPLNKARDGPTIKRRIPQQDAPQTICAKTYMKALILLSSPCKHNAATNTDRRSSTSVTATLHGYSIDLGNIAYYPIHPRRPPKPKMNTIVCTKSPSPTPTQHAHHHPMRKQNPEINARFDTYFRKKVLDLTFISGFCTFAPFGEKDHEKLTKSNIATAFVAHPGKYASEAEMGLENMHAC